MAGLDEIGKTSGVGFKNVGGKALDTGTGFNTMNTVSINGGMSKSINETTNEIVNTKFANADFQSASLAALSMIKTELNDAFLQKDSPLALANNFTKGLNVINNR